MLKRWLLNAIILFLLAYGLNGVSITNGWESLLLAAAILGLINAVIRPIIIIITLPINIVTLGLFTLVINALMIQATAWVVPGFSVASFGWAFVTAVLFSIFSVALSLILK